MLVTYSYSTTNKMLLLSQIIYTCKTLYMFRSFRPSSGAQNCVYSNGVCQNSCCYLLQQVAAAVCTGHNTLRRHLHIIGLCNDPMYRKFGTEEETSVHILCECEALASPRHAYLGSFFWTRRTYGNKAWGSSGTLLKEQGSYSLAQNVGHKGPVGKA